MQGPEEGVSVDVQGIQRTVWASGAPRRRSSDDRVVGRGITLSALAWGYLGCQFEQIKIEDTVKLEFQIKDEKTFRVTTSHAIFGIFILNLAALSISALSKRRHV